MMAEIFDAMCVVTIRIPIPTALAVIDIVVNMVLSDRAMYSEPVRSFLCILLCV